MRVSFIARLIAFSVLVSACGGAGSLPGSGPAQTRQGPGAVPLVQQIGGGSKWVTFKPSTLATTPYTYDGLVDGPNGNVWFEDISGNGIVRLTQNGTATEFPALGTMSDANFGMAIGSDRRFYFGSFDSANGNCSGGCGAVDAMDTQGHASLYDIGTSDANNDVSAGGFVLGSDGNVWFTEYHHIGMITPAGVVTQYPYPGNYQPSPGDIALGSDHNLWFTLGGAGINPAWLGTIVPSTGVMTFYNLTSLVGCQFDNALTAANDGNIWVDCGTKIVRVTPAGIPTAFTPPSNAYAGEVSGDMTSGAGHTLWYGGVCR